MAWEPLPVDYTDAIWSGLKRYKRIDNSDGTVSFQDVTQYTKKDDRFFGAKDVNRINEALNTIKPKLENGIEPTVAAVGTLGVVKPDGTTITIRNGVIKPPWASPISMGTVQPAMHYWELADDGTLSVNTNKLWSNHNAGVHNSIYRGKRLGSVVSDSQYQVIADGTFEDLYIGDYWTIGGINYRIAAFDYYYPRNISVKFHHVTLVPDTRMYTHAMNDTSTTAGAYVGSKMYKEGLNQAKTTIQNAFGEAHILNHTQQLTNRTVNGYASASSRYDSTVELMTEQNVVGCRVYGNIACGNALPDNTTYDSRQFPLFRYRPDLIGIRSWYWLRDVVSTTSFAIVTGYCDTGFNSALYAGGVRPAFSIKA